MSRKEGNNLSQLGTRDFIQKRLKSQPEVAIVAGSGLSEPLSTILSVSEVIPYGDIPGFPIPTVVGHKGALIIGMIDEHPVILFSGRKHLYEGAPLEQVVFAGKLVAELKIPRLILTNAAGGLNPEFKVGDLMLITEAINLMFRPFLFSDHHLSKRLWRLDASRVFSEPWRKRVNALAEKKGIHLQTGVYIATTGPSYETPAEVGFLRAYGGDAIGMSTLPEALVAAALGVEVLGISFITNLLAEIPLKKTSHEEVIQASTTAGPRLAELIRIIINET